MDNPSISYSADANFIYLNIPDPHSRKGFTLRKVKLNKVVDPQAIQIFASAWIKTVSGYSLSATLTQIVSLKSLLYFLGSKATPKPQSMDWQNFVCDYFEYFLTNKNYSTASLKTRVSTWSLCHGLLSTLKVINIIPKDVKIPISKLKRSKFTSSADSKQYVVGESIIDDTEYASKDYDFYCVDLTYALDATDYFDCLSTTILDRLNSIQDAAKAYWANVKKYHEIGATLISTIDNTEWEKRLKAQDYFYQDSENKKQHLITSENGMAWLLKYLKHQLTSDTQPSTNISISHISNTSFFTGLNLKKARLYELIVQCIDAARPNDKLFDISRSEVLSKFLGLLSSRDCACVSVILIHEHPELTPLSIVQADITSSRGKTFLYAGNSRHRTIFSSSKPRAGKRIISVLTTIAKSLIDDVLEATADIRHGLKGKGASSRRLFLTSTKDGFGVASNVIHMINSKPNNITLYDVMNRYIDLPFDKNTLSLSRIRCSQGIIEWLKSGSIDDMARRMSNGPDIVLRHYLPKWLIEKWNERIIRRYQQTLILLAAYKSPWLLDASDFSTGDQLLQFINSIISISKTGDPLSDLILERLGPLVSADQCTVRKDLLLKLSAESLHVIYLHSEDKKHRDDLTKHESAICDLADLIKSTLTLSTNSTAEIAIKDKIQGDSFYAFKKMHVEALARIYMHENPEL